MSTASSSRAGAVSDPVDVRDGTDVLAQPADGADQVSAACPPARPLPPAVPWRARLPSPPPLLERQMWRVRRQLDDPLTANGYALVANSGVTGVLGLLYWLAMARLYPTSAVGRASALYAAMNLLAGFTAQSFNGALNRFIPQAGLRTRSFVLRAYAVSAAASTILAIVFVVTAGWWGTSYSELNGPIIGTVFVCSVVAWAIFTLQDSVLVGLRAAVWVLVENGLFGVLKLLLLIALVVALPLHLGIYVSWMVPAVVALPLINVLIFSRLVPRHTLLTRDFTPASNRQIGRFLAGDYSGALCMLATGSLIPVVVASSIGARQTAYFYIAWVIVGIVDMIGISMAMSLTVEASFDAATLATNCRAALRKIMAVLLPCAVLLGVFAPVWLGLFGPAYATQGTAVLRLLALACVCRAPTELYLGVLRAESRTSRIAVLQAVRAALTLGLTVALTGTMGALGAGVAVATTQAVALVVVAPGLWRVLRADRDRPTWWLRATAARTRGWATWGPDAVLVATTLYGLALFVVSLRRIDLSAANGLGLISVLPVGAIGGVTIIALAFVVGLFRRRLPTVGLAVSLVGLVICLDGVAMFAESEPRFATAYQIAGFVNYIGQSGHTAPGVAAYFSWPGFFALVAFAARAAGIHSLLPLMTIWPVAIDLACIPALFLLTRRLYISRRARWLAAFFFSIGNWVGQDYFSPQSFNYLLYLVFLAILVNWFMGPARPRSEPRRQLLGWLWRRPPREPLRPGERPERQATTGERCFLFALLVGMFVVSTVSHQLTPFFLIGASVALVAVRRCTLTGLPVLLGVMFAGYVTFATVDYWSGHISNVFGGIGDLGLNVSSSVGSRLQGSTATHLVALHAKEAFAVLILALALLGMARRRRQGREDRVLLALLLVPVALVGVFSYGGEIALRTYLFLLPPASIFAALLFIPGAHSWRSARPARRHWRSFLALTACAVVLPAGFFLARYGNEAFEQVPSGELAATNWIYAHDPHGGRVLWLSTDPANDVTPQMPWSYQDIAGIAYLPTLAPRDPADVSGFVSALRRAGPGSYLIATRTQISAMEQTSSYPTDWDQRFSASMSAAPGVRLAYSNDTADVYTWKWPPGARVVPPVLEAGSSGPARFDWTELGLVVFGMLVALLVIAEVVRICRPRARAVRLLWMVAVPLLVLFAADVVFRFFVLS